MSVSLQTAKDLRKHGQRPLPASPFMLFKHSNGDLVTLTIASEPNYNPKYWHASNWLSLVNSGRGPKIGMHNPVGINASETVAELQTKAIDAFRKVDLETVINALVECDIIEVPLGGGFATNDLSQEFFEEEWARILRFIKGAASYSIDGQLWMPVS